MRRCKHSPRMRHRISSPLHTTKRKLDVGGYSKSSTTPKTLSIDTKPDLWRRAMRWHKVLTTKRPLPQATHIAYTFITFFMIDIPYFSNSILSKHATPPCPFRCPGFFADIKELHIVVAQTFESVRVSWSQDSTHRWTLLCQIPHSLGIHCDFKSTTRRRCEINAEEGYMCG